MGQQEQSIPAYCPNCESYGGECSVDYEDWNEPCPYYKPYEPEQYYPEIEEVERGD